MVAAAVVAAADLRGVHLADVGRYHAASPHPGRGLVLGYGNLADTAVTQAVVELAAVIGVGTRPV